jgi:hypothetical protein
METIEYGQGPLPFEIPSDAVHTEITPYLWLGHYGEWDQAAQEFTAWALVSPSSWHVTWDFPSPPLQAVMGPTVLRLRFRLCDPPSASQEFHVELRRSSQLSDPSPTDLLGTAHPPVLPQTKTHLGPQQIKTHPEPQQTKIHPESLLKTHPESLLKIHPESLLKIHPESLLKTHPESLLKTHPESQQTHPEPAQAWALMKDRLAVWRIHTRKT